MDQHIPLKWVSFRSAATLHMACGLFDSYAAHRSPLKINCTNPWYALERHSPTVGNSPAAHVLAEERARWTALLPQDKGQWLQWFIDQPLEVSLSMVVLGTAQTVDAVQGRTPSQDPAKSLAGALGLDMVQWWSPTPDNYLSLVPKSELTQAVTQARGTQRAAEIAKLKKPEAIAFAARALEGSGWLPEPLRSA